MFFKVSKEFADVLFAYALIFRWVVFRLVVFILRELRLAVY